MQLCVEFDGCMDHYSYLHVRAYLRSMYCMYVECTIVLLGFGLIFRRFYVFCLGLPMYVVLVLSRSSYFWLFAQRYR